MRKSIALKIFITIPWFLPAFKAGGPIVSIANMVDGLDSGYEFYIFTSNRDLHGQPTSITSVNSWTEYNPYTKVWYNNHEQCSQHLTEQVRLIKPDHLFVLGIYSWHFGLVPLLFANCGSKILSVRGMMHPEALETKGWKKIIFYRLLQLWGIAKKVKFHATDETEAGHIRNLLGDTCRVYVANNIARLYEKASLPIKEKGRLKMISVGVISPMKNYDLVLRALETVKTNVEYHIYGPIKEKGYWDACLGIISGLPSNISVSYHKEIPPHKVESKLSEHHVFILPSRSENFGHAMAEAMSAGLPLITSKRVPWNGLAAANAGMNVEADTESITGAIDYYGGMDNEVFAANSEAASNYIQRSVNNRTILESYRKMFSN